jgi:hypothetical protein
MVSPTHRPNSVCFPCNSSALSLQEVGDNKESRNHTNVPRVMKNCESFEFLAPLFAQASSPRWGNLSRGCISSSNGSVEWPTYEHHSPEPRRWENTHLRRWIRHLPLCRSDHRSGRGSLGRSCFTTREKDQLGLSKDHGSAPAPGFPMKRERICTGGI